MSMPCPRIHLDVILTFTFASASVYRIIVSLYAGRRRRKSVCSYKRIEAHSKVLIPTRGMFFMRGRCILCPRKVSSLFPGKDLQVLHQLAARFAIYSWSLHITHIGVVVVLGGGPPRHNSDSGRNSLRPQSLERSQSNNRHSAVLLLDTFGTVGESESCGFEKRSEMANEVERV